MAELEAPKVNPIRTSETRGKAGRPMPPSMWHAGGRNVESSCCWRRRGTAPSTEVDRRRRRFVWTMVAGFLTAWFLAFFRFFLPRTLFEPNTCSRLDIRRNLLSASTQNSSKSIASGWTELPIVCSSFMRAAHI